ncbi:hypothetical protein G647_08844 [Cladophialophora carrionii CBS 160.54]|uniref:Uncharacterized protein n=1 Tax=Cladophialophora carrionii CBS 160.54 TaxID=1279043 RepID=V9CYW2_9EURO|nr:uncharacterized protein G647_08844 [Cladophialophora carrionii CBS 160.54]ETI19830.1 hypothetical protein G647_08844 [Cladophialophora carrionii CBS 160.54]
MSSTGTRSDLPATGSTYQPTKSEAISFSNNNPFGSSGGQHHHHQHHQHQVNGPDPTTGPNAATATATTATTAYDSVTQPNTAMRGAGPGTSTGTSSAIPDRPNPTTNAINHADEANPLQAHHRPSLAAGAAAAGENEHHGAPGGLGGDETIRRHSVAQNAPGKLGERGENILGAIGFGGAAVERPKEDQGIGEKIAEFLGA